MIDFKLMRLLKMLIAKGNQRRPLNSTAISATLLPAVWLTRLLGFYL
jgi:hypothetical protein